MPEGGGSPAKRVHRATGRPRGGRGGNGGPVYSQALADRICARLATGESLRSICRDPGMPSEMTVREWAIEDWAAGGTNRRAGFALQYARARELGYHSIAEEILDISDEDPVGPDGYVDNGAIQRARHRTDSRRWYLSKMMPRQFGDKVTQEIVGNEDQPLITRIELVPVDPIRPKTIDHEPGRDDGNGDGSAIRGTSKL